MELELNWNCLHLGWNWNWIELIMGCQNWNWNCLTGIDPMSGHVHSKWFHKDLQTDHNFRPFILGLYQYAMAYLHGHTVSKMFHGLDHIICKTLLREPQPQIFLSQLRLPWELFRPRTGHRETELRYLTFKSKDRVLRKPMSLDCTSNPHHQDLYA